jgi:hypothetical protein
MTESASCPEACPWKDGGGCYAELGRIAMHWRALDNDGLTDHGKRGVIVRDWDELCDNVYSLPRGQIWRHNAAGDLPGHGDNIDIPKLVQLVKANAHRKKQGFTYTHKPVSLDSSKGIVNAQVINISNRSGFTINLSADGLKDADDLYDIGCGPVVTVLPSDSPLKTKTPKGRHVIVCPAEYTDMTCDRCELCAKPKRKVIIGFRAHGVRKNKVNKRLKVLNNA